MDKNELDLVVSLMGSTFGELKQLDSSIIGASSTLNRRSDDVKKQLADVLKQGLPPPQAPQIPQWSPAPVQQQTEQVIPSQQVPVTNFQPQQNIPQQDPNQLEFDLNKAARYDDVINKLDEVMSKLKVIEDKIDNSLLKRKRTTGTQDDKDFFSQTKKKKVTGTQDG